MDRIVQREWLDDLPPCDPQALGSRRDLRRLNAWMGNVVIMSRALEMVDGARQFGAVTELGSGDGDFLANVARRLGPQWQGTTAVLLDRQRDVAEPSLAKFRALQWNARPIHCDVLEWSEREDFGRSAVIVANLFLHHFAQDQLAALLTAIERRCDYFIALEPRRSGVALFFSKMVGVIGCNAVTRHDAPVSVRAGFKDQELSRLWPNPHSWNLSEGAAQLFGHLFVARRKPSSPAPK